MKPLSDFAELHRYLTLIWAEVFGLNAESLMHETQSTEAEQTQTLELGWVMLSEQVSELRSQVGTPSSSPGIELSTLTPPRRLQGSQISLTGN